MAGDGPLHGDLLEHESPTTLVPDRERNYRANPIRCRLRRRFDIRTPPSKSFQQEALNHAPQALNSPQTRQDALNNASEPEPVQKPPKL